MNVFLLAEILRSSGLKVSLCFSQTPVGTLGLLLLVVRQDIRQGALQGTLEAGSGEGGV
jgi:hypothetical protein